MGAYYAPTCWYTYEANESYEYVLNKLLKQQLYCLVGDEAEQQEESRRADLRKGQRSRRKTRMKEIQKKITITTTKTKTVPRQPQR